ncbi:MAG: SsrA-binding protein SmpB [Planctomycetaceae bacterium]|nr:SsrA-binding protein SmpB [Planctomycetaceae bacterium]
MAKKKKESQNPNERVISENRKARHDYLVLDTLECGLVLVGSEVKSLRDGSVSITEAYGKIINNEVWLIGADVPEYREANRFNHKPKRPRKLLIHRREYRRFAMRAYEKGLTLVPLKLYFNQEGRAKLLLGLCKGKQLHDKRAAAKDAAIKSGLRMAMMKRR